MHRCLVLKVMDFDKKIAERERERARERERERGINREREGVSKSNQNCVLTQNTRIVSRYVKNVMSNYFSLPKKTNQRSILIRK